ncbi:hypothetical protein K4K61_013173 [Colletotrichum sp. SAR11_59]|nr:hypothetical protein K4K61_013173 [Colletotrichum sp. SAR11_59]
MNFAACSAATLFCLGAYVSTKFIYLFMVDRAHIIRQTSKPRMKSKLYIFNSFGMLGVFVLIVILNFIFRITNYIDGICIIGLGQNVILALISFDAAVNVYLTIMFLLPLLIFFSALVMNWITSPGQESTLRTLTRPSRVSHATLRPEEDPSMPLDPDGNSTNKTWEQRRTHTPTTIGLHSAEGDNLQEGEDLELNDRHSMDHGERVSLEDQHDDDLEEPEEQASRHSRVREEKRGSKQS